MEAALQALSILMSWPMPLYVVLGTLVGLAAGVIPGLSGAVALALLIPLTIGMEFEQAMVVLSTALGGTTFGGAITAILINTPGTPGNAATLLDGYPMSERGRAGEAIGAAGTASALGAIIGLAVLVAVVPFMREMVLAFGPPELFLLAVFGLTIIAGLSEGRMVAGLMAGAIGVFLSLVGGSIVSAESRFTFGQVTLLSGFNLVPVLIGLFAVGEMLRLLVLNRSVAGGSTIEPGGGLRGVRTVFRHPIIVGRSSLIGTGLGAVPGIGGTVAAFFCYSLTRRRAKDPSTFGKGDVRGVIASEAANDAVDGGTLMPTLALGIPGNPSTAILLAALIMHGVFPGRQLFTQHLHIVYLIAFALVLSNLITSSVGIAAARYLARMTTVPVGVLVPSVLIVTVFGAFGVNNRMFDVWVALGFGFVGYLMIKMQVSRVPMIIGLILGGLIEQSLHTSLGISRGSYLIFVSRPISIIVVIAIALTLAIPMVKYGMAKWGTDTRSRSDHLVR